MPPTLPPARDEVLADLAARLREADDVPALAAAVIAALAPRAGVRAVAVESHDADGPATWFTAAGCDELRAAAARRYLAGGHLADPALARARATLAPVADAGGWLCPIAGCGALRGLVRLDADDPGWATRCAAVAVLTSVRAAELGAAGDGPCALTARQYEVTVLVARGSTNAEIGRLLSISADAVKKHVSRALAILEVSNRTELAALAGRWRCPPDAPRPALHVERRPAAWTARPPRSRAA